MQSYFRFSLSLVSCLFAGAALAENRPLGGAVYNFELNERINYFCQKVTETELKCDFTRATVSQVLPTDRIAQRRAEELAKFDEPGALEEIETGVCEAVERMDAEAAEGKEEDMRHIPKADRDAMILAFRDMCTKKGRASKEAYIDLFIDIESRTCMVSTFGWTGRFSRSDEKTWVRTDKDGPSADGCAGVYLDRFELSKTGSFWDLTRRAIASNPNGTFTTGEQCSEIYTGEETKYQWQGGDLPGRCDYIRLNLFD